MIKEDIEFMGPVRIRDIEEAQQNIVNIIRNYKMGKLSLKEEEMK